ncbi:DUF4240 domain-containing protein [Nonomuraea sp. MTCD27]|uniref:DUF4240 domain-containing protein n=1 Tax=Nonomuraea sp. MTCD27 TaxID=1676747 RepID=UPI0035BED24F
MPDRSHPAVDPKDPVAAARLLSRPPVHPVTALNCGPYEFVVDPGSPNAMLELMDIDGFWELVERTAQETGNRQERLDRLAHHLSRLPAEEIVDFEAWFTICANRACSWDMYAACWTITGSGSSDGFEYFVDWLISLGRDSFDKVADVPDRIVQLPEIQRLFELSRNFSHERTSASRDGRFRLGRVTRIRRQVWPDDDYPEFELFSYVASSAYRRVTGVETAHVGEAVRARGIDSKFPFLSFVAEPDGQEWDFSDRAEFTRRLPRLARHRGLNDEPDEPDGRRSDGPRVKRWPRLSFRGDERTRAWLFRRKDGDRISVRDRRHLRCEFGIEKTCTWPAKDNCFCAPRLCTRGQPLAVRVRAWPVPERTVPRSPSRAQTLPRTASAF